MSENSAFEKWNTLLRRFSFVKKTILFINTEVEKTTCGLKRKQTLNTLRQFQSQHQNLVRSKTEIPFLWRSSFVNYDINQTISFVYKEVQTTARAFVQCTLVLSSQYRNTHFLYFCQYLFPFLIMSQLSDALHFHCIISRSFTCRVH